MTNCRWSICALLFFATTINYVDRAVLGILKPVLEKDLGWTQIEYGWMVTAFQLTYALGYVFSGHVIDRVGVRAGFVSSVSLWSLAATPFVASPWVVVSLVGLAAAAHCGFAANLFTLVSDTVPKQGVSSVVGIGGMAGALGGMVFAQLVSRVLEVTHNNYAVPFAIASMAYLAALAVMHLLVPRLERMRISA